jgi:hypothetical protein
MKTLFAAALVAAVAGSSSATVIYSTSFENFANGNLPGQNGWATAGASALFQVANTAGLAATGSKYVTFNTSGINSATTASRWSWIDTPVAGLGASANPIIRASANVAIVNQSTTRTSTAGLDLYDNTGSFRIGAIRIRDDGGVDFLNGKAVTEVASLGAGTLSTATYWNLRIDANFSNNTLRYYINGTEITGFGAGFATFTGSTGFGDADLYVTRTNPAGSSGGDTAFFDDLLIENVPTPGSLSLLALAGIAAGRRRR